MKNEIIVHMGIPKTGTSSLQKFLVLNNEVLMENGYCYPNFRKTDYFNAVIRDAWRWGNGVLSAFQMGYLNEFNEMMEESLRKYHVILSDESIWVKKCARDFIRYLKDRYKRVKLIVYLKRQDMYMESGYAEHVRNLVFDVHCTETIQEFRKSMMQGAWVYKHFYYERLKEWEQIVGRECMAVYTYEEAKEQGLFKHFVEFLKLDYGKFQETESANISLSAMDTEIKRRLNQVFSNEARDVSGVMDEVFSYSNLRFDVSKGYLLTPEERLEILGVFDEDNKKTAEEYFSRKDLFPNKVDYPPVILNEKEVEKNYVKALEQLIVQMAYRKKYPMLKDSLSRGKKIALFGAGFMGRRAVMDFRLPAEIIIDNDKGKQGQMVGGIPVVWSGDFTEWNQYVILTTPLEPSEIEEQLQELGLIKNVDFMNIHTMELW